MRGAPLLVSAGVAAGLAGVLVFHSHPAARLAALHAGGAGTGGGGTGAGSSPGPGAGGALADGTATGVTEQYGYGELAVRVRVASGKIVSVVVPLIRTAEPYSQQLAAQVIPMLRNEVLSAQSAQINGVSGATYTSRAYAMSLQAALDKLGKR